MDPMRELIKPHQALPRKQAPCYLGLFLRHELGVDELQKF